MAEELRLAELEGAGEFARPADEEHVLGGIATPPQAPRVQPGTPVPSRRRAHQPESQQVVRPAQATPDGVSTAPALPVEFAEPPAGQFVAMVLEAGLQPKHALAFAEAMEASLEEIDDELLGAIDPDDLKALLSKLQVDGRPLSIRDR